MLGEDWTRPSKKETGKTKGKKKIYFVDFTETIFQVATSDGPNAMHLICVYNKNYLDKTQVKIPKKSLF